MTTPPMTPTMRPRTSKPLKRERISERIRIQTAFIASLRPQHDGGRDTARPPARDPRDEVGGNERRGDDEGDRDDGDERRRDGVDARRDARPRPSSGRHAERQAYGHRHQPERGRLPDYGRGDLAPDES